MAKDFNIERSSGQCGQCQAPLAPGQRVVATIWDSGLDDQDQFVRQDFCEACWAGRDAQGDAQQAQPYGVWTTTVPEAKQKRKLFVDDDVLLNFFYRLEGNEEPGKLAFRFVLALVLMRKKLLVYEGLGKADDGAEVWKFRLRGAEQTHLVVNPQLDETKIAEVSAQLGEILEAEL